jgi:NTE family protein
MRKKIAIACQGGGSHCAFTGGVLAQLLSHVRHVRVDDKSHFFIDIESKELGYPLEYELIGLSGTSGGAISAYMAWLDLLRMQNENKTSEQIRIDGLFAVERFWKKNAAKLWSLPPYDLLSNWAVVVSSGLQGYVPMVSPAPNLLSKLVQEHLIRDIKEAAVFDGLKEDGTSGVPYEDLKKQPLAAPVLFIGAANVNEGEFQPFVGMPQRYPSIRQVVASTALPDLFPSVDFSTPIKAPKGGDAATAGQEKKSYYWDGLLSQNPPISDFLSFDSNDEKPDEIWVVRINPAARCDNDGKVRSDPPVQIGDIYDRRNELTGNLSLEQEKRFVRKINSLVRKSLLSEAGMNTHKEVRIWGISLDGRPDVPETEDHPNGHYRNAKLQVKRFYTGQLDYSSKLLRSPGFLDELKQLGKAAVAEFFAYRASGNEFEEFKKKPAGG